jgi:hypothetical protein
MMICHSLPTDFCLRRAVRALAATDRQTSPVRASWGCPADGRKYLIATMFVALMSARLRFLPCFPLKNRGGTRAPLPLFAASTGVISGTTRRRLACATNAGSAMTLPHAKGEGGRRCTQRGGNASGNQLRFRRHCGGLLPVPCQVPCQGRGRVKSYPAGRAGWARQEAPNSLSQNDFSAHEQARFWSKFNFYPEFPVRQEKVDSHSPASPTAARARA